MRKHLRDALSIVAAIAVVLLSIGVSVVFADPSAVLMKTGDAEVGKTIKISVKVSGDGPYGGYNGSISVDSSYFEIISISAVGFHDRSDRTEVSAGRLQRGVHLFGSVQPRRSEQLQHRSISQH